MVPYFSTETNPPAIKAIDELISKFNETAEAKVQVSSSGSASSRGEVLIRKFQLEQEIGVFELEDAYLEDWSKAGYLEPLDDVLAALGEDYFIEESYYRSSYDGHVYGLPAQINPAVTYYRSDLFDRAGLSPPEDINELIDCAQALTQGDTYGISIAMGPDAASGMALTPAINQAGGDYFDSQGNLTFDRPEVRQGLENHLSLLSSTPPGIAAWGYTEVLNSFLGGNVAMMHAPSQYLATILADYPDLAEVIEVAPISPFGGPLNGATAWGRWQEIGISANTKNKEGAKEFLKYWLSQESRARWIESSPGLVAPTEAANEQVNEAGSDFAERFGRLAAPAFAAGPVAVTPLRNMGSVADGAFTKTGITCPWAVNVWGENPIDINMLQRIVLDSVPLDDAWAEASAEMDEVAKAWKTDNPDWESS